MPETPSLNSPAAQPDGGAGVFVGRQSEMADLISAWEDTLSGRGRLVMLVGEPGIGKTRTAQELTSYTDALAARVEPLLF